MLWPGKTVAILATGPNMNQKVADLVRHLPRIAVRRAFKFAPHAEMLISLDGPTGSLDDAFWEDARDFTGLRVCGLECEVDALYPGMMYETVTLAPGNVVQIRNNLLAAIRIAVKAGAARIRLLGVDTKRYEEIHAHTGFVGLTAGLQQITAELRGQGIEVESL